MFNRFFVFEGMDGGGKTGLIKEVAENLEAIGFRVFIVREPGGSKISEHIRELLLNGFPDAEKKPEYMTEALLFNASRAELMSTVIIPKLKEGYVVLSDRFVDSTLVYQGYCAAPIENRIERVEKLMKLHEVSIGVLPRATVFIECDPDTAFKRSVGRGELNLLDGKDQGEARSRYEAYHAVMKIKEHKHQYYVFDNSVEGERAFKAVADKITRRIESTIVFDQRTGLLAKVLEYLKELEFQCHLKSEQCSLVDRLTLSEDKAKDLHRALIDQDGMPNWVNLTELSDLGFNISTQPTWKSVRPVVGESWIQLSCGRVFF